MLYERVVAAIIPSAGIQRTDEVKAFFDDYRNKKDKAKDVIALSLDALGDQFKDEKDPIKIERSDSINLQSSFYSIQFFQSL